MSRRCCRTASTLAMLSFAAGCASGPPEDPWQGINRPVFRFNEAADEVGRFIVNTTVGLAGFFDPATHFGFPRHDKDVGQMLGRWGIPSGPFLMLPLLGPSNPREIAGMVGDSTLSPFRWIPGPVTGTGISKAINSHALADKEIQQARDTAFDFYVFQREAFSKNRAAAIANDEPEAAVEAGGSRDDLYDLPEAE